MAVTRSDWTLLAICAGGFRGLSPVQLQKTLFLLGKQLPEAVTADFYDFQAYHYGPFDRTVYVDAERLSNTTCFALPGLSAEALLMNYDLDGVALSSGSACSSGKVQASHVLAAMGVAKEVAQGAIRVSLGWNTTEADISHFIAVTEKLRTRNKAKAA